MKMKPREPKARPAKADAKAANGTPAAAVSGEAKPGDQKASPAPSAE